MLSPRRDNCDSYLCPVADLHSKILDAHPPGGPNSFKFMQFLGNSSGYDAVPDDERLGFDSP